MITRTQDEVTAKWPANEKPLVSIRCTAFNHEKFIAQCLEGFLIQETDFPFEVCVHDDASSDNTAKIIQEYAEKYPKIIKPLIETENQYSKNDGSFTRIVNSMLNSKYIAVCEGDDFWTDPQKLQRQISYLESHPDCSAVIHRCMKLNDRTGNIEGLFPKFETARDIPTEEIILGGGGFFGTNTIVYHTEIKNFYAEEYWDVSPVGDFPLILSCAYAGRVHYMPEAMSVYRIFSQGSWSSSTLIGKQAFAKRSAHIEGCEKSLRSYDKFTKYQYSKAIQEKIDLNNFNLYWDYGMWTKLKTTSHYQKRSLIGKMKALYHCISCHGPMKFISELFFKSSGK